MGYVGALRVVENDLEVTVDTDPGDARNAPPPPAWGHRPAPVRDAYEAVHGFQLDLGMIVPILTPSPTPAELLRFEDEEDRRVLRELYGHHFPMPHYTR